MIETSLPKRVTRYNLHSLLEKILHPFGMYQSNMIYFPKILLLPSIRNIRFISTCPSFRLASVDSAEFAFSSNHENPQLLEEKSNKTDYL